MEKILEIILQEVTTLGKILITHQEESFATSINTLATPIKSVTRRKQTEITKTKMTE